jgi:T4-like virus Myoviridae tail sheath stabiliser
MQYWYSAQIRQYRLQFIRAFSNFYVKTGNGGPNGTAELLKVPCRYGDPTRIASTIVSGNSENKVLSVPFITCFINNFSMAADRRQVPRFSSTVLVNERAYDDVSGRYTNDVGNRVKVERYMPVPYDLTMQVDIWTNNEDIKEQLLEQILVLYNPSIDLQTSVNPIDWTVLTVIEMLDNINWSSRTIPVGTDNPINVCTMMFKVPIWINPPAKLQQQVLINEIITNIVEGSKNPNDMQWTEYEFLARKITTPGNAVIKVSAISPTSYALQLCHQNGTTDDSENLPTVTFAASVPNCFAGMSFYWNGIAITVSNVQTITDVVNDIRSYLVNTSLNCVIYDINSLQFINSSGGDNVFSDIIPGSLTALGIQSGTYPGGNLAWWRLLLLYGNMKSHASYGSNGSQIRLKTVDDIEQVNSDLVGWIDFDTFDQNQLIWSIDQQSLPTVTIPPIDAIIDPQTSGPNINLPQASTGQRYLITENSSIDSQAWGHLVAYENDIIEYNGATWYVSWSAANNIGTVQYVLNNHSNKIYRWNNDFWESLIKSKYMPGYWTIVL